MDKTENFGIFGGLASKTYTFQVSTFSWVKKKISAEARFKWRRKIPSIDGRSGKVTGQMVHMLHSENNPLEKVISGLSEY